MGAEPLRIAFITSVYPNPVQPVLGTFAEERVRALARRSRVDVFHPRPLVVPRAGGSIIGRL